MLRRGQSGREHKLASDERAGRWARAKARNRQRAFAKKHWRVLFLMSFAMFTPAVIVSSLGSNDFLAGATVGAGAVATGAAVYVFILLLSGTAPTMMGDLAEQWTSQELRPLRQHGWKLVNHFGLGYGDQDHVLIGPGGLFLFETKWSASDWRLEGDARIELARKQLTDNAKSLQLWAKSRGHLVDQVQRVLVLWGEVSPELEDAITGKRHPDGTLVIRGRHLGAWALRLGRGGGLTEPQATVLWQDMDRQLIGRDALERERNPLPQSMWAIAIALGASVLTGLASLVGVNELAKLTPSTRWGFPIAGLGVALGLLVRRVERCRPYGTAVATGAFAWLVIIGLAMGAA